MSLPPLSTSTSSSPPALIGDQSPRIGTPLPPGSRSLGPVMVAIAGIGGIDYLPWQVYAANNALQLNPTGRWAKRGVGLLVARQNGKTKLLAGRILAGLFAPQLAGERLILHTAQDRTVPREVFEALVETIDAVPAFRKRIPKRGIREANGQERIRTRDGTTYRLLAPRPAAFRSWAADLIILDEGRELSTELWGAAIPTQRARPNPQWWVVSNAGDADALLLHQIVTRGRAAAADPDSDPRMCYLEWSAADPACELTDRAEWARANPSLGYFLTEETILEELVALDETAFRTEILCQSVEQAGVSAVPAADWVRCTGTPTPFDPEETRPWFGVGVDPDGRNAALVAAAWTGEDTDRRLVVQLVESWSDPEAVDTLAIAAEVLSWVRMWRPRALGYEPATDQVIADHLSRHLPKGTVVGVTGQAFTAASSSLWDAVVNHRLLHPGDERLNAQVAAAGRSDTGDGNWRITRKDSGGPIPAVTALARAVHLAYGPTPKLNIH